MSVFANNIFVNNFNPVETFIIFTIWKADWVQFHGICQFGQNRSLTDPIFEMKWRSHQQLYWIPFRSPHRAYIHIYTSVLPKGFYRVQFAERERGDWPPTIASHPIRSNEKDMNAHPQVTRQFTPTIRLLPRRLSPKRRIGAKIREQTKLHSPHQATINSKGGVGGDPTSTIIRNARRRLIQPNCLANERP